jgi:hypothetical protein
MTLTTDDRWASVILVGSTSLGPLPPVGRSQLSGVRMPCSGALPPFGPSACLGCVARIIAPIASLSCPVEFPDAAGCPINPDLLFYQPQTASNLTPFSLSLLTMSQTLTRSLSNLYRALLSSVASTESSIPISTRETLGDGRLMPTESPILFLRTPTVRLFFAGHFEHDVAGFCPSR